MIYCPLDYMPSAAEERNVSDPASYSSFFFIEGNFYTNPAPPSPSLGTTGHSVSESDVSQETPHDLNSYDRFSFYRSWKWLQSPVGGQGSKNDEAQTEVRVIGGETFLGSRPLHNNVGRSASGDGTITTSGREGNRKAAKAKKHKQTDISMISSQYSRADQLGLSPGHTPRLLCMASGAARLGGLQIRLGVRYLYSHLNGRCEHCIYFTDVRLHNPSQDPRLLSEYPRRVFLAKMKRRKCDVCDAWSGRYLVFGDKLADTNPCLFCQHCYHMLHYSSDGELLYDDFTVFPYLHNM